MRLKLAAALLLVLALAGCGLARAQQGGGSTFNPTLAGSLY